MEIKVNTTSRVIELVRAKIGTPYVTASDTDISRALGLSRTAVSSYKHGKHVMSLDTLAQAQEILQLPKQEYFDLMLALSAEGTTNPTLQESWGQLHRLVRGALKGSKAASWIAALAMVAAGTFYASPQNVAHAAISTHQEYTLYALA
jgi:transcriptional regulator with XRE-family HTH domain